MRTLLVLTLMVAITYSISVQDIDFSSLIQVPITLAFFSKDHHQMMPFKLSTICLTILNKPTLRLNRKQTRRTPPMRTSEDTLSPNSPRSISSMLMLSQRPRPNANGLITNTRYILKRYKLRLLEISSSGLKDALPRSTAAQLNLRRCNASLTTSSFAQSSNIKMLLLSSVS